MNNFTILEIVRKLRNQMEECHCCALAVDTLDELEEVISKEAGESIFATSANGRVKRRILSGEVSAIVTDGRFTSFYVEGGERFMASRLSLNSIFDIWGKEFVAISRNAMVRKNRIKSMIKDPSGLHYVVVSGLKDRLYISRRRISDVRDAISC